MIEDEEARWPNVGYFLKRLDVALIVCIAGTAAFLSSLQFFGSYQFAIGKVLPIGEKVSGLLLQEQGFDRVCLEPLTDPAILAMLRVNSQHRELFDLFGGRRDSSRIVYFAGQSRVRYALVHQLHIDPTDFYRPLASADQDCWPLSRVMIELQPASRYRTQPPKRKNTSVEDLYLWMTIDNSVE